MELPPLANLMPAGFEGNLSVLSPDFSLEVSFLPLLNQMVNMGERHGHGNGFQGGGLCASSEEPLSPRSDEETSFPSYALNPLLALTLIHPMNVSSLSEDQEPTPSFHHPSESLLSKSDPTHFLDVVSADIQRESLLFSEKVEDVTATFISRCTDHLERPGSHPSCVPPPEPFDLPFRISLISQDVKGQWADHSLYQAGSGEMASDLSLLRGDVSEINQRVVNRMNLQPEEPFSLSEIEGKDAGNGLMTDKIKGDGQRVSTSFIPISTSSEKGEPDLTPKPEFLAPPHLKRSSPESGNDNHGSAFLKNDLTLSGPCLPQNSVGPETKMEPSMPEAVPKGQSGFSQKVESFEIYHQVGRKIAWSVQNGEERVRLRLDPPGLGNLYMEVTKEKEAVSAILWAEIPTTKELLDAHRIELRKVLEESGFRLERFDVFVQQEADRFMERREFPFFGGQQNPGDIKEEKAILFSESSGASSVAVRPYPGASNYIDRII